MDHGDFYGSEKSVTLQNATQASIQLISTSGTTTTLKSGIELLDGEIIDAAILNLASLKAFAKREMDDAKAKDVLFSVHLKATMMKVSDPIIFGAFVEAFFETVFAEHATTFESLGVDVRNGLGDVYSKIATLPEAQRISIENALDAAFAERPDLAMVNSDKGITNLHVPSDVIIDASMPAMIRNSGQMWDRNGQSKDTKAVIPDRSYAGVYHATIDFCRENGALDPRTMGSVSNIGLMAQKAEEYGSHDKTFQLNEAGTVQVIDATGQVLLEQTGEIGDIFRMCQVKDAPIQNWIKLGVERARATGNPAVFWLDSSRAHDAQIIDKLKTYLPEHDTDGLAIEILSPVEATRYSLERIVQGQDTISVTGNVLRDYLTDLFPILEVGTSAKMLSIVPLMNGGGLFETGAGGSAPKHVQQLNEENYLRWDSLGEFLALAVSLEHLANHADNPQARILGACLDEATTRFLDEDKSPTRKLGGIDNRGSHFYLALYWAEAMANQTDDAAFSEAFSALHASLTESETTIVSELNAVQGLPADTGGYYRLNQAKAEQVMRPSSTLNKIIGDFHAS
jgi:isocitrate dehydrogenase